MNKGEGTRQYQTRRSIMTKGGLSGDRSKFESGARELFRKTLARVSALALVLGLLLYLTPQAFAGQGASWQIGRGVIQKAAGQQAPVLKLSLRNDGTPSKANVRILVRWSQGAPGKRSFSAGELGSFSELGSFAKEVELKSTAILEISLAPAGPPQDMQTLEIAVLTDRELTDGQAIRY